MVPIGIVTRNRALYLDITLRSLSATRLPPGVQVTVFDDASDSAETLNYYKTDHVIPVETHWPRLAAWEQAGLNIISDNYVLPVGISELVDVQTLGSRPLGVVNASCRAICRLFDSNPGAYGVILLQDDVLFKEDWYERLTHTAQQTHRYTTLPLGLLSGLKINHKIEIKHGNPPAVPTGITAQCLYISRTGFIMLRSRYFDRHHQAVRKFDDSLRKEMQRVSCWAGCIYPFVCQHFGIRSLVRPSRRWEQKAKGRIGYYVNPPYALAGQVKRFKG